MDELGLPMLARGRSSEGGECTQFLLIAGQAEFALICEDEQYILLLHIKVTLTLFYTRGLGIIVLHVMVPEPYRFPLCFSK